MTPLFSPEQVLRLAPDDASRANAGVMANPRKWIYIYRDDANNPGVVWGECQGSGAQPYRSQIALLGPGFACTCPSRKHPCKHSLGLLLLFARQPEVFEVNTSPEWLVAWLEKQAALRERANIQQKGQVFVAPDDPAKSAARQRRSAARDQKILDGLDDLEIWLQDLLRQGLVAAQPQQRAFWETPASRLVDAQAPGLARLVRSMADLAVSGDGWQERLLDQIARLVLAIEGYRRINSLPPETQADLRSVIGFTIKQEDILRGPGVRDTWLVIGRRIEEETGLKIQRTWLVGQNSGRAAMLLSFAPAGNGNAARGQSLGNNKEFQWFDQQFRVGTAVTTELVFYPGAFPLRAAARSNEPVSDILPEHLNRLPACSSLEDATAGYAAALAANPWLELYPMILGNVHVHLDFPGKASDSTGRWLPFSKSFYFRHQVVAISGGRPLNIFAAWDGEALYPYCVWNAETYMTFPMPWLCV